MSWECSLCNYSNAEFDTKCEMCDALRSTQRDIPIKSITVSSPALISSSIKSIYSSKNIQYQQENEELKIKLMNITAEYNNCKQVMSSKVTMQNEEITELQLICNELQSKNDKLEISKNDSNKSNEYDEIKRLKAQLMQLQIMINILKDENNNIKQQNLSENKCKDNLQKENNDKMKEKIGENKKLQFQLQNVIDHHNEYKELMEGESREKDKLIQCLQENNNDQLIDQYSNQLNQFQTMMIEMRNKNRNLKIENDSMKKILSEHNLHSEHIKQRSIYPVSSPNILSNASETDDKLTENNKKSHKKTETMMNRLKNVFNHNNTNDANIMTTK